jgi:hypothetical protein
MIITCEKEDFLMRLNNSIVKYKKIAIKDIIILARDSVQELINKKNDKKIRLIIFDFILLIE